MKENDCLSLFENCKDLNLSSSKDALHKVWLKLVQWICGRRILDFVNVFSLFRYHRPLKKGVILYVNKLASPLSKNDLCQVWMKWAQLF